MFSNYLIRIKTDTGYVASNIDIKGHLQILELVYKVIYPIRGDV